MELAAFSSLFERAKSEEEGLISPKEKVLIHFHAFLESIFSWESPKSFGLVPFWKGKMNGYSEFREFPIQFPNSKGPSISDPTGTWCHPLLSLCIMTHAILLSGQHLTMSHMQAM